jgi:RNA polymerase sigma-70 factor (ECF subfamily)
MHNESHIIRNAPKGKEAVGDDQTLMRLLQQGDEAAFEQIVRHWEKPMLNFFYRSLSDLDTAEDLRQELFVRLYAYRASYRGNGSFRAWLYQLATNLLRTHLRRAKTLVPLDGNGTDGEDNSSAVPDNAPPAGEVLQRRESARLVREMLATLSSEDREALILRFYEGLRYGEICQALDIAETSAKSRVYRAIERLRQMVAERGLSAADLL